MTLRGRFLVACLGGLLLASSVRAQAVALPPVLGATELFHSDPASGLALRGYDPVSYFLPEGPRPGKPEHEFVWSGVAWRFASEANRAAFEANPPAFAPRFGGYDAEAVSRGRIVDTDPALFVVRDDRLYLFRSDANRARFLADPAIAERGEEAWARQKSRLVKP
jgi:hypothetical protein